MLIGIVNQKQRGGKVIGAQVSFGLKEGSLWVDVVLETEKKRLLVSTPLNLQGEVFEIPELGNYVPAIMNKTAKSDWNIKI